MNNQAQFDQEAFVTACLKLPASHHAPKEIIDLVTAAVSEPEALIKTFGRPNKAKLEKLHVSNGLTILNVVWSPGMKMRPHNHNVWAVIGVYCGREDNTLWRRIKNDGESKIEAAGTKSIGAGEVAAFGKDLIHSVINPLEEFTAAIHVYGANFFEIERSEWPPETLKEQAYDITKSQKLFQ